MGVPDDWRLVGSPEAGMSLLERLDGLPDGRWIPGSGDEPRGKGGRGRVVPLDPRERGWTDRGGGEDFCGTDGWIPGSGDGPLIFETLSVAIWLDPRARGWSVSDGKYGSHEVSDPRTRGRAIMAKSELVTESP